MNLTIQATSTVILSLTCNLVQHSSFMVASHQDPSYNDVRPLDVGNLGQDGDFGSNSVVSHQ
jgi:hypothetical protein